MTTKQLRDDVQARVKFHARSLWLVVFDDATERGGWATHWRQVDDETRPSGRALVDWLVVHAPDDAAAVEKALLARSGPVSLPLQPVEILATLLVADASPERGE